MLGRHAAERRAGEPEGSAGGRIVDNRPPLVGVGGDEDPHELPQVKVEPEHLVGEVFEQVRVARRVAQLKVVNRLDEHHAHHLLPHPVGNRAGKLSVVVGGQPGGELLAMVGTASC